MRLTGDDFGPRPALGREKVPEGPRVHGVLREVYGSGPLVRVSGGLTERVSSERDENIRCSNPTLYTSYLALSTVVCFS